MAEDSRIINNWYIILGLEYYLVPEKDEKKIEARIEEKKDTGYQRKVTLLMVKNTENTVISQKLGL